jgi:hypothetical protein
MRLRAAGLPLRSKPAKFRSTLRTLPSWAGSVCLSLQYNHASRKAYHVPIPTASGETLDKALVYLGATDAQMEDHRQSMRAWGAGKQSHPATADEKEAAQDRLQQALNRLVPLLAVPRDLYSLVFFG